MPYRILVSEMMLQQTQVARVLPKYRAFLARWGSARALARAPLGEVLRAWQGLGYNRRAKALLECVQVVTERYRGRFPHDFEKLVTLPGVGPYTAQAIMAFAYNQPVVMIETNIRTVYLHHFFNNQTDVLDSELIPYIQKTVDNQHPREWYWALMDYGSHLKQQYGNANIRSRHHIRQSRFKGSDREIRGALLRVLSDESKLTRRQLAEVLSDFDSWRVDQQITQLLKERLISSHRQTFFLPL